MSPPHATHACGAMGARRPPWLMRCAAGPPSLPSPKLPPHDSPPTPPNQQHLPTYDSKKGGNLSTPHSLNADVTAAAAAATTPAATAAAAAGAHASGPPSNAPVDSPVAAYRARSGAERGTPTAGGRAVV